ncbi:hypothetical protein JKI95_02135 [Corynebacterium aquatimens]|uniref:hypothetical protein n=1 Tax=Corynebacterium TaxID=1716 RepID=UPI001F1E8B03|nr:MULTISPECIES: hypothetical protein [Corynebacterium]QYH19913.1 hypothetical protein JKI95_02135 [Corynebacterium aquatimens]UIZ92920.1 hypothetical protein JZY91_04030 [Corynebacterium sp. CNCTC7651]
MAAENWHLETGDERIPLPDQFESWSQGTSFRLTRRIEIDLPTLLSQSGLPNTAEIGVSVSWMSSSTKIRRRVFRSAIRDEPISIIANLNGDEISGEVDLRTTVILNSSIEGTDPWVASEVGSILLAERRVFGLGFSESGFPMSVVDFALTTLPIEASWHLETSVVLEDRFSSSFQVLVNERDEKLIKAMEADKPTKEQNLILQNLMAGVMEETLRLAYALRSSGELALDGYEYGSVGEVLSNLVKRTGDVSLDSLTDPSQLALARAQFEAMARTLGVGRQF